MTRNGGPEPVGHINQFVRPLQGQPKSVQLGDVVGAWADRDTKELLDHVIDDEDNPGARWSGVRAGGPVRVEEEGTWGGGNGVDGIDVDDGDQPGRQPPGSRP